MAYAPHQIKPWSSNTRSDTHQNNTSKTAQNKPMIFPLHRQCARNGPISITLREVTVVSTKNGCTYEKYLQIHTAKLSQYL